MGPVLQRRVEMDWRMAASAGEIARAHGVHYRYISDDPEWSREKVPTHKWRKVPEWAATHIRITARHISSGEPLGALADLIASIPGCVEVEQVGIIGPGDGPFPHVVAIFERAVRE